MSNEQTILNPKTDWVFKLMFSKGEEGNKALISFLNAFLEDSYGKITKAEIINTIIYNLLCPLNYNKKMTILPLPFSLLQTLKIALF